MDVEWIEPPLGLWARANAELALACIAAALVDDRAHGVAPDETRASIERFVRRLTAGQRQIVEAELTHRQ